MAAGSVLEGKVVLLPDVTAPAAARHAVGSALTEAGVDPSGVESALLLTSELVSNAVEHARTELCVEYRITDVIRIAVSDTSDLQPIRRSQSSLTERGRGLHLLDQLAESWGIERQGHGKTVYFHLRLPDRPVSGAPRVGNGGSQPVGGRAVASAFRFAAHPDADHVRVELAGELDAATAGMARERFLDALSLHPGWPVVVDLAGLSFCDSTGLGALLFYRHTLLEAGVALRLRRLQDGMRRLLDATGMTRLFTIEP